MLCFSLQHKISLHASSVIIRQCLSHLFEVPSGCYAVKNLSIIRLCPSLSHLQHSVALQITTCYAKSGLLCKEQTTMQITTCNATSLNSKATSLYLTSSKFFFPRQHNVCILWKERQYICYHFFYSMVHSPFSLTWLFVFTFHLFFSPLFGCLESVFFLFLTKRKRRCCVFYSDGEKILSNFRLA